MNTYKVKKKNQLFGIRKWLIKKGIIKPFSYSTMKWDVKNPSLENTIHEYGFYILRLRIVEKRIKL